MSTIKIYGKASGKLIKTLKIKLNAIQNISLMDFLRTKGIPIASSCLGEGVCRQCVINNDLLSCQIALKEFCAISPKHDISISYL